MKINHFIKIAPPEIKKSISCKNIRGHVIFSIENQPFHQDRPRESSCKNIKGHVIFSSENRSFHQDRPPRIFFKMLHNFLNDFLTYRLTQRGNFFNVSLIVLNDFSTCRCAQRENVFKIPLNLLNDFFNI